MKQANYVEKHNNIEGSSPDFYCKTMPQKNCNITDTGNDGGDAFNVPASVI